MNIVKTQIINLLSMENVLNKYGIKINHNRMYHCPFHEDKSPSAKCYDSSFYCFSCNRSGDLINFVQFLYNLNFQEGMDKIIDDFQLGLKSKGNYDRTKILEIEKQRQLEEEKKKQKLKYFSRLCNRKHLYNRIISNWKKQITKDNWENMVLAISYLETKVELLDIYICENYNIDY